MKRIAVLGFALESNAFAPTTTRRDFEDNEYVLGEQMLVSGKLRPYLDPRGSGFAGTMTRLRDWQPVPILFAGGGAGGPCDHDFFLETVQELRHRLSAARPIDAVYIIAHGAGITTRIDDLDGAYFSSVREVVGPDVPIVATLDLHGNVSQEMVASTDVMIAMRTNPHVDMVERSAEAAVLMNEMFHGMRPCVAFIRLPLVTPQVTQLTAAGSPYGDLIERGQEYIGREIANVSILSGFAFSDSIHNGMAILVTSRNDPHPAERVAAELARLAWRDRARYVPHLISLQAAVARALEVARDPAQPPIVLADVADNPGGGGRGNTTWLLEALFDAGASGVQLGLFYDPPLVEEAREHGVGAQFLARFNRAETNQFSRTFTAQASVVRLTDGKFDGLRGTVAGVPVQLGPSCLLRVGGIHVAVISLRQQIFGSEALSHFGLDPAAARCIVVKSRGHFRAGFAHLFSDERIFEVDCPGLTTPNLKQVSWRGLRRPVYPLDPETRWP